MKLNRYTDHRFIDPSRTAIGPARSGAGQIALVSLVALLGTLVLLLAVPFIRAGLIQKALRRADQLLQINQPAQAVQCLQGVRPWARILPANQYQVDMALIRGFVQSGNLPEAAAVAQEIQQARLHPSDPPPAAGSTPAALHFLEVLPNRIYRNLSARTTINGMDNPHSGYELIRSELAAIDRMDLLTPIYAAAGIPLASQSTPAAYTSIRAAPEQATPPVPAEAIDSPEPPPPTPSPVDIERERAQRAARQVEELRSQQKSLEANIAQIKQQLAALNPDQLTPAQKAVLERYRIAKQKFDQFVEKSSKLKNEMDRATGPQRMELLDELRKRRFDEVAVQDELNRAKQERDKAMPQVSNRDAMQKKLQNLLQRLEQTQRQLQSLEKPS